MARGLQTTPVGPSRAAPLQSIIRLPNLRSRPAPREVLVSINR